MHIATYIWHYDHIFVRVMWKASAVAGTDYACNTLCWPAVHKYGISIHNRATLTATGAETSVMSLNVTILFDKSCFRCTHHSIASLKLIFDWTFRQ